MVLQHVYAFSGRLPNKGERDGAIWDEKPDFLDRISARILGLDRTSSVEIKEDVKD
jgi:hypothetical protein